MHSPGIEKVPSGNMERRKREANILHPKIK
jgi:hypothetical protein